MFHVVFIAIAAYSVGIDDYNTNYVFLLRIAIDPALLYPFRLNIDVFEFFWRNEFALGCFYDAADTVYDLDGAVWVDLCHIARLKPVVPHD